MHDDPPPVKPCTCGRRSGQCSDRTALGCGRIEEFALAGVRAELVKGSRQIDRDQGRRAATRPRRTMDWGVEEAIRQAADIHTTTGSSCTCPRLRGSKQP
jgi:hypothetical protein